MWHEARKQERKIRGMLVDYRKRAERRQDFYEKIKDPTQFLQLHGRKCKIHLDNMVATAAENPAIMVPWQGQKDTIIDRFDARAHLDYIPPVPKAGKEGEEELSTEDRQCNYERYRILAQNEFLGVKEELFLQQLQLEEQFGVGALDEKSKKKSGGAAIGYSYEESEPSQTFSQTISAIEASTTTLRYDDCLKDSSDSDLDMDVSIDINKVETAQAHEINACGRHYGMQSNDFYSYLTKDFEDAEALKMAQEEEQEKILLFGGRKSRRERRQREKRFTGKIAIDSDIKPSYAKLEETSKVTNDNNDSESRSPSPENSGKITYITSFGGEESPHTKKSTMTYAEKVKQNLGKLQGQNERSCDSRSARKTYRRRSYSRSSSEGRSVKRSFWQRKNYGNHYRQSRDVSPNCSRRRKRSHSRDKSFRRHRRRSSSSSSTNSSNSNGRNRRRAKRRSPSSSSSSSARNKTTKTRRRSTTSPSSSDTIPPSQAETKAPAGTDKTTECSVPIKKYYGRKRDDIKGSSSDDVSLDEGQTSGNIYLPARQLESQSSSTDKSGKISTPSDTKASTSSSTGLNPRDRLKRKMQLLLNKQYKEDKKAETMKKMLRQQEEQERENEMRELALKLRKRQRELRHRYGSKSNSRSRSDSGSDNVRQGETKTSSKSPDRKKYRRRSRSPSVHDRDRNRSRTKERSRSSSKNRFSKNYRLVDY